MTFGQTSLGRSMSRTGVFFKKQLWIWPIVAVVLLAIVGYAVSSSIQQTMEDNLRSELETLLTVERSMLEKWFKVQESSALTLANSPEIRKTVAQLLAANGDSPSKPEHAAGPQGERELDELHARLGKGTRAGHVGPRFRRLRRGRQATADRRAPRSRDLIGQTVPQYESFLTRTLEGKPTVSAPFPSVVILKDRIGPTAHRSADDVRLRAGARRQFAGRRRAGACGFVPRRNSPTSCNWDGSAKRAKPMPSTRMA